MSVHEVSHGWPALVLLFWIVPVSVLIGLIRRRGRVRKSRAAKPVEIPTRLDVSLITALDGSATDDNQPFKIIGARGAAGSAEVREMLSAVLRRGDPIIIVDPDGAYHQTFYDPNRGDVILGPFAAESVRWSLLAEIRTPDDVDQLARSVIPAGGGEDGGWSEYARLFFTAVVQQALAAGLYSDRRIYQLLAHATPRELQLLLAGTAAARFLEEGCAKMFQSLRSVACSALRALDFNTRREGIPFCVRGWVRQSAACRNGEPGAVLFLPYKAAQAAAARTMISAWIRLAIFEAMSQAGHDQHLWLVIDDADSLATPIPAHARADTVFRPFSAR